VGLRKLATFNEDLRDSPSSNRNIWVRISIPGEVWLIPIKHIVYRVILFYTKYIVTSLNLIL
jgi:hypothetical protein